MNLDEIEKRLSQVETRVEQLGVSLARSLENVRRDPATTCTNNRTILEYMLRDLWKRLHLKGSPEGKQLKELLEAIPPRMEQLGEGSPRISRRIYDLMRGIQLTGNRSTHHPNEVVEDDAIDSMRELSEVVLWYFAEFLPSLGKLQETTPELPLVSVNSPTSGARWQAGNFYEIAWTVTRAEAAPEIVAIEIELWNQETKLETLTGGVNHLPGNARKFGWTVPATVLPGSDYRIKVIARNTLGQCGEAFSSGHFTIDAPPISEPRIAIETLATKSPVASGPAPIPPPAPKAQFEPAAKTDELPSGAPPEIKIISPGGENWRKGGTHLVAWTISPAANKPAEKIAITLAREEKSVLVFPGDKQFLPGDATSYKLTVSNKLDSPPAAANYQIKVSVWRKNDPEPASAVSPRFSIRSSWQNAFHMWLGIFAYVVIASFILFGLAAAVHDLFSFFTSGELNRIPDLPALLERVVKTIVGGVFTGGAMFFPFLFLPAAIVGVFWGFTQYFQGTRTEVIGMKLAVVTGFLACLVAAGVAIWVLFGGGPFRGLP
ncbi:MAG TPA: Ser-Thr-rich GPI-anchored membrane family protein [Terrimicrobiaceae bacterium]|nr:Ser-Thr-rich GPI-anchored membrane family protein [Terrimicrobiaceae bacterium]